MFHESTFPNDDISDNVIHGHVSTDSLSAGKDNTNTTIDNNIMIGKRMQRMHKQPNHLRDYHCYLTKGKTVDSMNKGKLYPIADSINYDKLSQSFKSFSLALS